MRFPLRRKRRCFGYRGWRGFLGNGSDHCWFSDCDRLWGGFVCWCSRRLCRRRNLSLRRRFRRLLAVSAAEKPLQQPRPARFGGCLHLTQRLALQAAEFTQQQRQFPGLTDTAIQLFGKFLQGLGDFPWQRQRLQLSHQRVQCSADLINPGFATLLGIEHGFFQARQ